MDTAVERSLGLSRGTPIRGAIRHVGASILGSATQTLATFTRTSPCGVGAPARPDTVETVAVEPADVGEKGESALQAVRMRLDHPRDDDVIPERVVDPVRAPRPALVERAGCQHPAVPNRDGIDVRL